MAFKDIWRPRVDGVDDADSSAVNEIAEAIIKNEEAIQNNMDMAQADIQNLKNTKADKGISLSEYGIEDAYTKEQVNETFQKKLSAEQLENIEDVQNKVPKEQGKGLSTNDYTTEEKQEVAKIVNKADVGYVKNTFANAFKGTVSGEAVAIADVSPVEHNVDVKVRSKNVAYDVVFNDVAVVPDMTGAYGTAVKCATFLQKGKTYTISFDTENTGAALMFVNWQRPYTVQNSRSFIADGTRKTFVITMTDDYSASGATMVQMNTTSTANSGLCSNFMIEEGDTATEYTPYVPDVSAVSLMEYGKNLIDIATPVRLINCKTSIKNNQLIVERSSAKGNQNIYCSLGDFKSFVGKTVTLSIKNNGDYNWTISLVGLTSAENNYGLISLPTGSVTEVKSGALKTLTYTIPESEGAVFFGVRMMSNNNSGNVGDIITFDNCQVEVGDTATEYEPYKEPTTHIPNADGTVEGVTSVYPTTTLIADTEGVIVDAEYNRDLNKAFAELEQKLTNAVISLGGNV